MAPLAIMTQIEPIVVAGGAVIIAFDVAWYYVHVEE
jgi:hypothetical protein